MRPSLAVLSAGFRTILNSLPVPPSIELVAAAAEADHLASIADRHPHHDPAPQFDMAARLVLAQVAADARKNYHATTAGSTVAAEE